MPNRIIFVPCVKLYARFGDLNAYFLWDVLPSCGHLWYQLTGIHKYLNIPGQLILKEDFRSPM